MLTYFIVMFISLQKRMIDPESNKVQLHEKIFGEEMCTQAKYMSLTVSIKFINGKIWVFTPL